MNYKFIYTLPFFVLAALLLAFSNGPAGGDGGNGPRMQDRSGSPFAITQGPTCAACHNNGSFNPGLVIELLQDGNPVQEYVPGESYTLRYTVEANSGSPSKFGVQSVILTDNDDSNAGTFGDAPNGTRVATISSRKYFEHSTGSNENTFEIEWTAPEDMVGDVTIYAAGVAANGNGNNGGDNGAASTLTIMQTPDVSGFSGPERLPVEINVFPNPMSDVLSMELQSSIEADVLVELVSLQGQPLFAFQQRIITGSNTISENISQLPSGMYLLKISNGQKVVSEKVFKL